MKILFISSNRLGDGVISTAAITYFIDKYPDCEITAACGELVAEIYAQFDNVKETIILKKEKHHKHWLKLWKQVYKTKWDIVIDLRNSMVSRLIFGKEKYIWGKPVSPTVHTVYQLGEIIKADKPAYAKLVFKEEVLKEAEVFTKGYKKILAIGPTANWAAKTWEAEKFIELIKRLDADYNYDKIAIIAARGEESIANRVLESIPEEKRIDVIAKVRPVVAAAILSKCSVYIGNDSGLMHSAGAIGIPTLGLFGPTNYINFFPWGPKADHIITPIKFTKEQIKEYLNTYDDNDINAPTLMTSLTVDAVYDRAKTLIEKYK